MNLLPLGSEIWIAAGPSVCCHGVPFPTRMTVVRLANGDLWVHAPVPVKQDELSALESLGRVGYLVAETRMHIWRLEQWAALFPNAERWGPPRIPHHEQFFTHVLCDEPPRSWVGEIDQLVFRGSRYTDEVYFLHRASQMLLVGDFIQNFPRRGPIFDALLRLGGLWEGGTPIDIRATFIGKMAEGRISRDRILAWNFNQVVLAHGTCVEHGAKRFVERAFGWLG